MYARVTSKFSAAKRLLFAVACLVLTTAMVQAQIWTPLTHQPTFNVSTMLLLTDGTVMCHEYGSSNWWRLTPDQFGNYGNGTWSKLASMDASYAPTFFASAVLKDGRVVVIGGEYNFNNQNWTNKGAVYNPRTNSWTNLAAPPGWTQVGDSQSVVLPNGTFLISNIYNSQMAALNPTTMSWTLLNGIGKADRHDEEGWTLMPDGTMLTVDSGVANGSERYFPAQDLWQSAGNTIVNLADVKSEEVGPALLRPDGTVFATGATGHNAVYRPNLFSFLPGTWVAAPDFPNIFGQGQLRNADGPAALLPNGHVLVTASLIDSNDESKSPTHFFEYDGANLFEVPGTPDSPFIASFQGRMLLLPTGQVLFSDGSSNVELYTSFGSANSSWAPVVDLNPLVVTHGTTIAILGKQFNGLSQAVAYGDDAQAATNYPLVRITNTATGHVFYCRTHDHSTMGVATGLTEVSTQFDVPAGIERGNSTLVVVANGIASAPRNVIVN